MAVNPVLYSPGGRVSDVLVATWSDGTALYRTELSQTMPNDRSVMFAFRGPLVDTENEFAGGFFVNPSGVSVPSSFDHEELGRLSSHGRWVLDALGLQPASHSPVWGGGDQDADPLVARLSHPSWVEARRAAVSLDTRMRKIWDSVSPGDLSARVSKGGSFLDFAEEVGDRDFYHDAIDFCTRLLDPVVVRISTFDLKRFGVLRVDAVRPKASAEPMSFASMTWTGDPPEGWGKVGTLDQDRSLILHGYRFDGVVVHLMAAKWVKVLPEPDYSRWFAEHTLPGELSLSLDEIEVYEALGEQIPLLWPASRLSEWAADRWGGAP